MGIKKITYCINNAVQKEYKSKEEREKKGASQTCHLDKSTFHFPPCL